MTTSKSIAVIGTVNPEIITGPIPALPDWGKQARSPRTEIIYAGSAARVAFPLRCLGHQVSIFGVVGRDAFGDGCIGKLRSRGIDIRGIEQMDGERTASCIAIVREDAQRTYISDISILDRYDDAFIQRSVSRLERHGFVLLTGLFAMPGLRMGVVRDLFSELRAKGVTTLLDTGWHLDGWLDSIRLELGELLREVDCVLPNQEEIVEMTGARGDPEALLRSLRAKGANDIYLKLGEHGAACLAGDDLVVVEAVPVIPVNTTAAGECFNAGVLHGLAEQMQPDSILDFANRLSAHYVATGEYC